MLSGPIVLSVELRRGVELIVLELIHISGWSYWSSHPVCVVMCVLSGKFCLCVWRRGVGLLLNVSWELGSTTTAQFTAPAHYFHKTTSCVCFKIKHRESSETPSITVLWSKLWEFPWINLWQQDAPMRAFLLSFLLLKTKTKENTYTTWRARIFDLPDVSIWNLHLLEEKWR